MIFILGIILGLLIAIVCFLSVRRFQTPLERTAKRLENLTKQKGAIYIESDEERETENFISNLEQK